jgi:hypothetical protein
MNLPRAIELQRLSDDLVRKYARGEEPDTLDFWERWWLLSEEFLRAIQEQSACEK